MPLAALSDVARAQSANTLANTSAGRPTAPDLIGGNGVLVFAMLIGLAGVWLFNQLRRARDHRATSLILQQRDGVLHAFEQRLKVEYPHILWTSDRDNALCMTADGAALRFIHVGANAHQAKIYSDLTVDIGQVVSVELVHHHDRHTESTTVERKKGAISRAVAGELLFGGVGAIVGAASAGSTSKTTGRERSVYLSSELIFGLSDLHNPVVRFISENADESDRWLHRVRAAMAAKRAALP